MVRGAAASGRCSSSALRQEVGNLRHLRPEPRASLPTGGQEAHTPPDGRPHSYPRAGFAGVALPRRCAQTGVVSGSSLRSLGGSHRARWLAMKRFSRGLFFVGRRSDGGRRNDLGRSHHKKNAATDHCARSIRTHTTKILFKSLTQLRTPGLCQRETTLDS